MSSDGKDPASTRQTIVDAMDSSRKEQQAHMAGAQEAAPVPIQVQDNEVDQLLDPLPGGQKDADSPASAIPPITEIVAQFGQYFALLLAPLLFAILTFFVVFAHTPPQALLPMVFVIIAVAVAQGVAVYYSGTSNRMWIPGTLIGLCLFVLIACFASFGPIATVILLLLLIAGVIALTRFYLARIPEGSIAIVHSMGKFSNILYPGPNILLPWERITHRLKTRETQWISPTQRVQMSQEIDVTLRAMIAYQLVSEYAYLALDHVDQWEESLRAIFVTSIQTIATHFSPDDFPAWPRTRTAPMAAHAPVDPVARWEQINTYLHQQVRDRVDMWGVEVKWVRIRDVALVPHGAPIMDTDPVENPHEINANAAIIAEGPTTSLPKASPPDVGPVAAPAAKLPPPDEVALMAAYKAVQEGKVTDPETIREFAKQFEQVASDPDYSQVVNFDASRAARNLYEQARRFELQEQKEMTYILPAPIIDDTRTGWSTTRPPRDENMMAGG